MECGWKKTAVQGRQCFTVQSAIEQHTIFSRQETKHGQSGADMHTARTAEQEWVVNRMTEDITFCQNGWEECQVTRCERHPSNIENPQLPHSYAKLYRTEYCPLEKPQPIDMVEVVRCKDCKHGSIDDHTGKGLCRNPMGCYGCVPTKEDGFCSFGEKRDNE